MAGGGAPVAGVKRAGIENNGPVRLSGEYSHHDDTRTKLVASRISLGLSLGSLNPTRLAGNPLDDSVAGMLWSRRVHQLGGSGFFTDAAPTVPTRDSRPSPLAVRSSDGASAGSFVPECCRVACCSDGGARYRDAGSRASGLHQLLILQDAPSAAAACRRASSLDRRLSRHAPASPPMELSWHRLMMHRRPVGGPRSSHRERL